MVKTWFIIILLFLLGLVGILDWLGEIYPYYSYSMHAKTATAVPASKIQKPGRAVDKFDEVRFEYPLRFKTDLDQNIYALADVPKKKLDELREKGNVTVLYLPDDPSRVIFEGDLDKMPLGFPSLLFGLVCFVVGVAAIKARHGFFRYTRYLPMGDGGSGSGQ